MKKIELRINQIWKPKDGGMPRQITDIRDTRFSRGETVLICWASNSGRWGECSERAFRRWAAGAALDDGIGHEEV
jgi:hypothetical protein